MDDSNKNQNKPINNKLELKIFVNSREKIIDKDSLNYEDIIKLAYENPVFDNPDISYTITYKLPGTQTGGSMVKSDKPIKIENGMVFSVTKSDKS